MRSYYVNVIGALICILLLFHNSNAVAEDILMVRATQDFPEAMLNLQDTIKRHGYVVSRVQRVDEGLNKLGYSTDKYRVVFFGKEKETRELAQRYPELIPYLPLNFTIFAEGEETIIATLNPVSLLSYYPSSELHTMFNRWEKDLRTILDELGNN